MDGTPRSAASRVVIEVVADVGERASGLPARLVELGAAVIVEPLPVGDFVVARGVLVERKSVCDLHGSVVGGRFWRQIGRLRRNAAQAYLLVEGHDLDRGPLHPNAVRGVCLAILEQGIPIIRSTGVEDSALWLIRLAARMRIVRPRPDRPVYDQAPSPRPGEIAEGVLAAVPGISVALSRRLLAEYGSVAGVISAGPEAWQTLQNIGPTRAAQLAQALGVPA